MFKKGLSRVGRPFFVKFLLNTCFVLYIFSIFVRQLKQQENEKSQINTSTVQQSNRTWIL